MRRRVERQNFFKFSVVKPSICRGWGFSFESRSSALADRLLGTPWLYRMVWCVQISKQIKQSWSQREETRKNLDEDTTFSPIWLRNLWVPRKKRFKNTISTLNINFFTLLFIFHQKGGSLPAGLPRVGGWTMDGGDTWVYYSYQKLRFLFLCFTEVLWFLIWNPWLWWRLFPCVDSCLNWCLWWRSRAGNPHVILLPSLLPVSRVDNRNLLKFKS